MRSSGCLLSAVVVLFASGLRAGAVGPAFAGDRDGWVGAEILLRDANVLKDLGLSDERAFRAILAMTTLAGKFNEELQQIKGLKGEAWKARHREIVAKVPDNELDILAKHLTAPQLKRLREIYYQTAGVDAFAHPEVLKRIAPTAEQKDKLKALGGELETGMKDVFKLFEAGQMEQAHKKESELRANALSKVQALLTEKQQKTWQDLTGKPIRLQSAQQP